MPWSLRPSRRATRSFSVEGVSKMLRSVEMMLGCESLDVGTGVGVGIDHECIETSETTYYQSNPTTAQP